MLTRKSGILALILGVSVFGAACEEKDTIAPPVEVPVVVNIVPETVAPVVEGTTVTLFASVTGSTNQAVTWSSTNTTVADVNQSGVVTTKDPGTTTIRAVSQADATKFDAVTITVTADGTIEPPPPGTPSISISQINPTGTITPVNPGNVFGTVDVVMNVDVPAGVTATSVQVSVVNAAGVATQVCSQSFTGGQVVSAEVSASAVPVQITCSINTGALLPDGTPRFPNGTYTVRAEVMNGTSVIAAANSQPLIFNNVNALGVTATADCAGAVTCPAADPAGLSWTTGNLTVTVTPAIFTGAANNVASGTITVRDANTGAVIAQAPLGTATAGTYSVTFTKAANATNGLLDVWEAESPITVQVTTITTSGNQGTGFGGAFGSQVGVNPLRLDNQRPDDTDADADVVSFSNPGWFSTTTSLTGANRVMNLAELTDEGVNSNVVRLEYNTNPAATNASAGWTTFTDVSTLPETTTSTQYAFRAVVCDALNNCTPVGPVLSGVDRSAPSVAVQAGSAANNSVNPTAEIGITGTDVISGAQIVRATVSGRSVFEIDANADTDLRCYNTAGALVATNPATGVCATSDVMTVAGPGATETQATVVIPADENWYTIEIVTVDVAGNLSTTTITRNNLVDAEVPTASIGSTTITGTNSSISGTVQDNIQVWQYDSRFQFALTALPDFVPFSTPTVVDATLDNTLTGQATANATSTLVVRSIEETINGAAITPTSYGFGVFDMANNFGFNGTGISFGAGDGVDNDASYSFTASPSSLCRSGTAAACPAPNSTSNTSATLSLSVTTVAPATPTTPFDNPIARVYWYYTHSGADNTLNTGDDYLVLIGSTEGSTATFTTSAVTGVRTFTMNSSVLASAFPRTGTFTLAALAVDSDGDAVLSTTTVPVQ